MKLQYVTILPDQRKVAPEVVSLSYKTKAQPDTDSTDFITSTSLKHKNKYIFVLF